MNKKPNSINKNLSKSSTAFFYKKEKNQIENFQFDQDKEENEELRRETIRENLKKMIEIKKENKSKSKEILVTFLINIYFKIKIYV